MTQRATLSAEDADLLGRTWATYQEAQATMADCREVVVWAIERSSFREVARLTGLSTNTLQRWKREATR